ncbi:MAG: serine/threonine-protein kinase, partial [Myxococcota bacterium]
MTAFDAIGAVLDGRYRLDAKLGEGGMGAVYRAHQLSAGRDVAVKLLHSVLSKDTALLDRFETEAKVIANLRHPNTLRLYDVGRLQDGRLFIVTELIEGESLAAYLAREPSLSRVLNLLRQVAEALSEAHERGVVHRDLKPANIMVERVGATEIAKVLDFGIAKLADQPKLTATGAIFGTPAVALRRTAEGCWGGE